MDTAVDTTTTEQQSREALRGRVHSMWASVATAWGTHADALDTGATKVTEAMLRAADPRPGEHVLELACGAGGVGLAAAALVGPGGEVVLSDVVPEMTGIASARAAERGASNVRTRVLDLESIDEPEGTYDLVLCREGLMFATEPAQALAEVRRVLRPGGRAVFAVWGPRASNPRLSLMFDAVSHQVGSPLPPPGVPGPFSLDDSGLLRSLLVGSGLVDAAVTEVATPMPAGSFDEWYDRTTTLAGPLAARLTALPDGAIEALRARLREAVRPYETPAGLWFPSLTLVASGRRA
jgi:ubiquinone/menaquinone biosynthesis C-methylase UbiE